MYGGSSVFVKSGLMDNRIFQYFTVAIIPQAQAFASKKIITAFWQHVELLQ